MSEELRRSCWVSFQSRLSRRWLGFSMGLRGMDDVFIVVPEADCRFREIVFVTQDAEAGGVEQPEFSGVWFQPQPPRGEHPQEMTAGEDEHVAVDRADLCDDSIGAGAYLLGRLAVGATVAEEQPIGPLGLNLLRPPAFVLRRSSIRRGRDRLSATAAKPDNSQVCRARLSGLVKTRAKERPASRFPSRRALISPQSVSGKSVVPVCWPVRLHAVSPWRAR